MDMPKKQRAEVLPQQNAEACGEHAKKTAVLGSRGAGSAPPRPGKLGKVWVPENRVVLRRAAGAAAGNFLLRLRAGQGAQPDVRGNL